MLRLVLPKGSLERATLELFVAADLGVVRSSEVDYRATIDDPRIAEVRILRPQEIPLYVADGLFDVGITGRDWVEERGSQVTSLGVLHYSKATANPIRVVLAVAVDSPVSSVADLAEAARDSGSVVRVSTEYPALTRRFLDQHKVPAEVSLSYGATEAKVPDIADCVVEITETGRALRAAGLKIIEILLVSHTELVANPEAAKDPDKRHQMDQLMTLLQGALEARDKVLVKLNVPADQLAFPRCGRRRCRSCSAAAGLRWRRWFPSRRSTR
jgi:ATP phosphoribosyltransferase